MKQTMTISQVIKKLRKVKKLYGDLAVVMYTNSERNGYGTLDSIVSFSKIDNILVLVPDDEDIYLDEVEGNKG